MAAVVILVDCFNLAKCWTSNGRAKATAVPTDTVWMCMSVCASKKWF